MASDLDATFKFRLPGDLLQAFNLACEDNDQTAAQVLRAAVREYVTRNTKAQGDLLAPAKRSKKCTCTITAHERQEDRNCPIHGMAK